jgi:transposase
MAVWDDLVMAKRYRLVQRDQAFLLPPDPREWLDACHPVWLVIRAVELMDTRPFHARRRLGGAGAAGYDPDMLLTVLAWAYAHGVTSSRRIEALCGTDVAFRVICGGNLPDHVTIARFRADFAATAAGFFAEVLGLCGRLGMGKLGVVALDGMKIAASASKSANRGEDRLRKLAEEMAAAHAGADAAEDDLFGPGVRGDEVPEDVWSPRSRDSRIAAALESLRADREAAQADRDARAAEYLDKTMTGGRPAGHAPAGADVAAAQLEVDRLTAVQQAKIEDWHARNAAAVALTGTGLRGGAARPREPAAAHVRVRAAQARLDRARQRAAAARAQAAANKSEGPGPVANITDPHSRLMPVRGGGFIQGYNAQNVTSEDGLIIATELTATTGDTTWFEPMLRQAEEAAALIAARHPAGHDGPDRIGLILADAGYCSEHNLTLPGPDRLIATSKRRDLEKAAAGGPAGRPRTRPATAAMAARLTTEPGRDAYRHRGHIAETPHGNIKHNMGIRQLTVRGKPKATAEWTFAATIHNLFKAISSGHLTHTALDQLTHTALDQLTAT